jgi:MurNAc alpha-1-phosphate uridylyltransferase
MKPTSPVFSTSQVDLRAREARIPETAMVFAAGLGTRMRPLTDKIPKALVRVAGRTLLDRNLDALAEGGVETAIVNVHHLADQIEAHLASRRRPRVIVSDERAHLLDQGGGIKKALPLIGGEPFLVCNTDAFWASSARQNLHALARAWDSDLMDAALLLASTTGNIGIDWSGDFDLDPSGRIVKQAGARAAYVYTGVGIIKPQLFANIKEEAFRLAPFLFDAANKGRLFGVVSEGLWCHVGTVAAIKEAEKALAARGR